MNVPRRYGILRFIALLLKVLAWAVLILSIIGMVSLFGMGGSFGPDAPAILRSLTTMGAFALPLVAIIWFVQLFAFGSILSLLIDIEQHTRSLASDVGGRPG